MIAGLIGVTAAMASCAGAGARLSVALMVLAGIGIGMQSAPMNSITQTLGGARAAGQWMGVQNLVANAAGVLAPPLTGFIVDSTGSYFWTFMVAAVVTLLGMVAYAVVVRRVEPVPWPAAA
jgi:MFS family permease